MVAEAGTSFPLTKIMPPRWHDGLISRPRLTRHLDLLLKQTQVAVISAPAGYGKTTLLAELGHERLGRCVWLRLDDGDRDVAQLLSSLYSAIELAVTKSPRSLSSSDAVAVISAVHDMRSPFELADRLAESSGPSLVVFDDFHCIVDSLGAVESIADFLHAAPSDTRIAIASRRGLTAQFFETSAMERIEHIGSDVLRYSDEEVETLLERAGVPIDEWPRMRKSLAMCEGWPAAINLAIRSRYANQFKQREERLELQDVFDQLATEAISQLPPSHAVFLHKVANFERIFPGICDDCLGIQNSQQLLDEISQMNLFLERISDAGEFRLHALFRSFLLNRSPLRSTLSAQSHLEAAHWYRRHSADVSELRHLIAAGDVISLRERLDESIPMLDRTSRWSTVLEILNAFEFSTREPLTSSLACWKANAQQNVGDYRGVLKTASVALQRTDSPELQLALHFIMSAAYQFIGDMNGALEQAMMSLAISPQLSSINQVRAMRRLGGLHYARLDFQVANTYFEGAIEKLPDDAPHHQAMMLSEMSSIRQVQGSLYAALELAKNAVRISDTIGYQLVQALARNNLGTAYHLCGDYVEAARCLQEALPIARQSQDQRLEAMIWLSRGDLYADLLQTDLALTSFKRGLALARSIGEVSLQTYALGALSSVYIMLGQLDESRRMLADAQSLTNPDLPFDYALFLIKDGALCIEEGNLCRAAERLEEARTILRRGPAKIDLARATLLQAYAQFLSAGVFSALPLLVELADLVRDIRYNAYLIPIASRMPRLWGAVIANQRNDLFDAIAQPDLRPRVNPIQRGLPTAVRFDDPHPRLLSPREREIVIAMCEGLSRDEIAARIGRSRSTLDKAISMIYAATGFTSSYQLVAWAHRCALYSPTEPPPPQTYPLQYVFQ